MNSRVTPIDPGDAQDERVNELLQEAADEWYGDAAFFGAMAHQPTVFVRLVSVLAAFPQSDQLSPELLELVRLKIAELHRCAYCATVRTQATREQVEPREDALFGEIDREAFSEHEWLALRTAEQLSTEPHRLTDEQFAELGTAFDRESLVELLLFVSLEIGLDRFCIALNLDTTERSQYPMGLTYPLDDPSSGAEDDRE